VAVHQSHSIPESLLAEGPDAHWHTPALLTAYGKLAPRSQDRWLWWRLPPPPICNATFGDVIEAEPKGVKWHAPQETGRLVAMMSPINHAKVLEAKKAGRRMVGGIYKRMRLDENLRKIQRAEVRFDDIAGCLRTPAGGSSRQTVMIVEANAVRSRLLSPREAARLMGLLDNYCYRRTTTRPTNWPLTAWRCPSFASSLSIFSKPSSRPLRRGAGRPDGEWLDCSAAGFHERAQIQS
jgi:DNA (cytosine-5)-methyltransferase 1